MNRLHAIPGRTKPLPPLRVGVGGPVGSGKTTLVEMLCKAMRDRWDLVVVTNDIYTKEDQRLLTVAGALEPERIVGVYSGPDFRVRYENGDEAVIVSITFACRPGPGEPRVNDDESLELRYFAPDALPVMEPRHLMRIADALAHDPRARFRRPASN